MSETALITGGSAGIGKELARLFAADRSNLVLVARREKKLNELADEIRQQHHVDVTVLAKDLARPQAPQEISNELHAGGIEIDVLVNNAGLGTSGLVHEIGYQRQVDMVQVNVTALTALTRLFLPRMIEQGRGGVLNVGSTAGFQPGPEMAVYYATKAYVNSFTDALYEELRGTGVKATCLCPGPTATEFGAESGMDDSLLFKLGTFSAARVAKVGYRGFRRGKPFVVPGVVPKLIPLSARISPRFISRKVVRALNSGGE